MSQLQVCTAGRERDRRHNCGAPSPLRAGCDPDGCGVLGACLCMPHVTCEVPVRYDVAFGGTCSAGGNPSSGRKTVSRACSAEARTCRGGSVWAGAGRDGPVPSLLVTCPRKLGQGGPVASNSLDSACWGENAGPVCGVVCILLRSCRALRMLGRPLCAHRAPVTLTHHSGLTLLLGAWWQHRGRSCWSGGRVPLHSVPCGSVTADHALRVSGAGRVLQRSPQTWAGTVP